MRKKIYVLLDERAWADEDAAEVMDVADTELQALEVGTHFPDNYLWYEYDLNECEVLVNGRPRVDLCSFIKSFKNHQFSVTININISFIAL